MTIAVDLGSKATKQTNNPPPPQKKKNIYIYIHLSKKKKNIANQYSNPLKWPEPSYIWKYQSTLPQPPGLTPSSPALCSFFVDFPLGCIIKL